MYRKPSSSRSLSYTSEMGVDTLTMLCPFTRRKKAWLALSCNRLLLKQRAVRQPAGPVTRRESVTMLPAWGSLEISLKTSWGGEVWRGGLVA